MASSFYYNPADFPDLSRSESLPLGSSDPIAQGKCLEAGDSQEVTSIARESSATPVASSRPGPRCSKRLEARSDGGSDGAGSSGKVAVSKTGGGGSKPVVTSDVRLRPPLAAAVVATPGGKRERAPVAGKPAGDGGVRQPPPSPGVSGDHTVVAVEGSSVGASAPQAALRPTPPVVVSSGSELEPRRKRGRPLTTGLGVGIRERKAAEAAKSRERDLRRLEKEVSSMIGRSLLETASTRLSQTSQTVIAEEESSETVRSMAAADIAASVGQCLGAIQLVGKRSTNLKGTFVGTINRAVHNMRTALTEMVTRLRLAEVESLGETQVQLSLLREELRALRVENRILREDV